MLWMMATTGLVEDGVVDGWAGDGCVVGDWVSDGVDGGRAVGGWVGDGVDGGAVGGWVADGCGEGDAPAPACQSPSYHKEGFAVSILRVPLPVPLAAYTVPIIVRGDENGASGAGIEVHGDLERPRTTDRVDAVSRLP